MDDREIMALYEAGDPAATQALIGKYGRLCRQIAGGILADPRDVEECVNDGLLTVWQRWEKDRPQSLVGYVCTVMRSVALDRLDYNRADKRNVGEILPIDELTEALPDESFREECSERELGQAIDRYLRGQKPDRADVFVQRYVSGRSIREIASRHRCSEAKICSLLLRMRMQLREFLRKEGYYFDEK